VLSAPQILDVPLLLLANKQDSPGSMSVQEIRENYEAWWQNKKEEAQNRGDGVSGSPREERVASLEVMGISALEGCVLQRNLA
jgi:ADP-ribosylation factor related protein 1